MSPELIRWRDAHTHHASDEWTSISDITITERLIDVAGFVVAEDEHHVVVASNVDQAAFAALGLFTVPKAAIVWRIRYQ